MMTTALQQVQAELGEARAAVGERDIALAAADQRSCTAEAQLSDMRAELHKQQMFFNEIKRERDAKLDALNKLQAKLESQSAITAASEANVSLLRSQLEACREVSQELVNALRCDMLSVFAPIEPARRWWGLISLPRRSWAGRR
jgi:chromosome segregation ATPase